MKKIQIISIILLLFIITIQMASAQKIEVQSAEKVIQKVPRRGLQTTVRMNEKMINNSWEDYLRKYGKVESSKRTYLVETAKIPSISEKPIRVISTIEEEKGGFTIFCAFDLGSSYITNQSSQYSAAEAFIKQFVQKLYEEEHNAQVRESEKILAEAVRQQEKKVNEGQNLVRNQERNRNEKANLEHKLEENRQEADKLVKEVEVNKQEQQTATSDVEKKRRALEQLKSKFAYNGQ